MAISLRIMEALKQENFQPFIANANVNAGADQATWIANAAFYIIPIIILWMGIGVAKSSGIAGADTVVGAVKKGGKWLANAPGHYSGVYGATKKAKEDFDKKGKLFGKKIPFMGTETREQREARWSGGITGGRKGYNNAIHDLNAKKVKEVSENKDTGNMTEVDLQNLYRNGNNFEKGAAMLELANRSKADAKHVDEMKTMFGDNSKVFNQIRNKVKTYDPTAAFATQLDAAGHVVTFDNQRMTEHLNSNQFDAKKVNSDAMANTEFVALAMETGNMKPGDLDELAKKGGKYPGNIKKSLGNILDQNLTDSSGNVILDRAGNPIKAHEDLKNENHRNIHLAHLASSGEIHSSVDTVPQRKEIYSRLNKDNAKNLSVATIMAHPDELVKHISHGNFKEIVSNMKDNASRQALVHVVLGQPRSPEVDRLSDLISRDPYLVSLV